MKTIGLTGPAGCGKDTIAQMLFRWGYEPFAFADPLKDGLSTMLQIPIENFYDRDLKELPDPYWRKSPRALAQTCGTEWAREFVAPDVWVRRLEIDERFNRSNLRVIIDVRFDNEGEWIRRQGGTIWHIYRDNISSVRPHSSEAGLGVRSGDVRFYNNGDLEDCKKAVEELIV